jgi:hypothetical protein
LDSAIIRLDLTWVGESTPPTKLLLESPRFGPRGGEFDATPEDLTLLSLSPPTIFGSFITRRIDNIINAADMNNHPDNIKYLTSNELKAIGRKSLTIGPNTSFIGV